MARKHSIGELISIRYSDRSSTVEGLVIDYNDDWTLMRSNPVDYVLDGFVILRHRNIAGYRRGEPEKFTEKIFKLKGISVASEDTVPLDDLGTILRYLTDRFDIFQFETRAEKQCYLGRLISIDSKVLTIDYLDTRGKWTGPRQFRPGDVRVIGFDTDYINSLKLVARKRRRSRL